MSLHRRDDVEPVIADFGQLCWHVNGDLAPGTGMTMGEVTISVGHKNPLHRHDNCEELLYLIEGALEHRIGDETHVMGPGDVIRVPVGVPHDGRNIGEVPARMVVAYNAAHSADRPGASRGRTPRRRGGGRTASRSRACRRPCRLRTPGRWRR